MDKKAKQIISKINKWNTMCSQSHDVYIQEIAQIALDGEYDCTLEENRISDFEKLSRIWRMVNNNVNYSSEVIIKKTREIVYK